MPVGVKFSEILKSMLQLILTLYCITYISLKLSKCQNTNI